MTVSNLTDCFIAKIQEAVACEWDRRTCELTKECLYDYSGVMLGGSALLQDRHAQYVATKSSEGAAPICGTGLTSDIYSAAALNSMSAHVLELDDGSRLGMLHPSAVVVPALLSASIGSDMWGGAFLNGMYAGYDAMIRLACIVQPTHKKRGFHATATCGTVAAAIAVGVARQYGFAELKSAVSMALTSSSGLLEMIESGSELKPYNAGQSAAMGLMAANIARCGYSSPQDALGGRRGFVNVLNGTIDADKAAIALGMDHCMAGVYHKAYASCRHLHAPVEAALTLRGKISENDRSRIARIEIDTYDLAVFGHDGTSVHNASEAKMSMPYAVAVAFEYGKAGLDAFTDDLINDDTVFRLMSKITVRSNPEMSLLAPGKRMAKVALLDDAGGLLASTQVDYPKGEPENPLTERELRKKFYGLARYAGINEERIRELEEKIWTFDQIGVDEYLRLIR